MSGREDKKFLGLTYFQHFFDIFMGNTQIPDHSASQFFYTTRFDVYPLNVSNKCVSLAQPIRPNKFYCLFLVDPINFLTVLVAYHVKQYISLLRLNKIDKIFNIKNCVNCTEGYFKNVEGIFDWKFFLKNIISEKLLVIFL